MNEEALKYYQEFKDKVEVGEDVPDEATEFSMVLAKYHADVWEAVTTDAHYQDSPNYDEAGQEVSKELLGLYFKALSKIEELEAGLKAKEETPTVKITVLGESAKNQLAEALGNARDKLLGNQVKYISGGAMFRHVEDAHGNAVYKLTSDLCFALYDDIES